tara:strand:+ start:20271 stop:21161 length:891 start_codon:yes stop_codon:yes gene_type:complete
MMDHKNFSQTLEAIIKSKYNSVKYKKLWDQLKEEFMISNSVPNHLIILLKVISKYYNSKDIFILDHGCGGCRTIFYLILLGYKNVHGVDVNNSEDKKEYYKNINHLLKIALDEKNDQEDRIKIYDGNKLPYKDKFFDFIFSQQVIEHLNEKEFRNFIKEENRTLINESIVYHQIPHKLVPTDTHTQSWFIHYLPRKVFIWFFKIIRNSKKVHFIENDLFLRYTWNIKNTFLKSFDSYKVINHWKINIFANNGEFSEFSSVIRKSIMLIDKIPFFGKFLSKILSYFLQLEIIFLKKS